MGIGFRVLYPSPIMEHHMDKNMEIVKWKLGNIGIKVT